MFNPCQSFSTVRFDGYFFTIKIYLCAGDYAATICAIKSTQLKQGRTTRCVFFNTRTVRRYLVNDLTCVARKATFKTQKRFHNKQYTPKLKDQPFESERTHFDTGFNNGSIAMHRPTIIFFFLTKSQPLNKKQPTGTINQIKQSEKTRPRNHSINNTLKTKHNKHENLSHQSIVKSIKKQPQQTINTISQPTTLSKQTIIANTTTHHAIHQDF